MTTNLEPLPNAGKPALTSAGVMGGVGAIAALVLPPIANAVGLTPTDLQDGIQAVGQIIAGAGILVGIWGRWRATHPITSVLPKGN